MTNSFATMLFVFSLPISVAFASGPLPSPLYRWSLSEAVEKMGRESPRIREIQQAEDHSPVTVQEVRVCCVYKLIEWSGSDSVMARLGLEVNDLRTWDTCLANLNCPAGIITGNDSVCVFWALHGCVNNNIARIPLPIRDCLNLPTMYPSATCDATCSGNPTCDPSVTCEGAATCLAVQTCGFWATCNPGSLTCANSNSCTQTMSCGNTCGSRSCDPTYVPVQTCALGETCWDHPTCYPRATCTSYQTCAQTCSGPTCEQTCEGLATCATATCPGVSTCDQTCAGLATCSPSETCAGVATCGTETCPSVSTCDQTCSGSITCAQTCTSAQSSSCFANPPTMSCPVTCIGAPTCMGKNTCPGASTCTFWPSCEQAASCIGHNTCQGTATCISQTCSPNETCQGMASCDAQPGCSLCSCPHQGDLNGNGSLDIGDLLGLIGRVYLGDRRARQDPTCPHSDRADLSCDGQHSIIDIVLWVDCVWRKMPNAICNPCTHTGSH